MLYTREGGYVEQQVFNTDETRLIYTRTWTNGLQNSDHISADEMCASGLKALHTAFSIT